MMGLTEDAGRTLDRYRQQVRAAVALLHDTTRTLDRDEAWKMVERARALLDRALDADGHEFSHVEGGLGMCLCGMQWMGDLEVCERQWDKRCKGCTVRPPHEHSCLHRRSCGCSDCHPAEADLEALRRQLESEARGG